VNLSQAKQRLGKYGDKKEEYRWTPGVFAKIVIMRLFTKN